ncbi:MAG: peptide chain release factor N(5)-glutamine methyltransferase [Saccharofermentans sp.]|nr:peptide chain release factor N(5)-glutamine methyltransferase [Saccharofermentans sp.]
MFGNIDEGIKILTDAGIPLEDARFDIFPFLEELGTDNEAFLEACRKYASGVPMGYSIGKQNFYHEVYTVTPATLIPRPDTELLVETALWCYGALRDWLYTDAVHAPKRVFPKTRCLRILDLCTGTGCVGISIFNALKKKYDNVELFLCDISDETLEVTRKNVQEASIEPQSVKIFKLDVLEGRIPEEWGKFDIVDSNPPYINSKEMDELDDSVKNYEPDLALRGGEDGLIFYEPICKIAKSVLVEDGILAVEHGYNQKQEVAQTLINAGFNNVKTLKDYGNNDRVCYGEV